MMKSKVLVAGVILLAVQFAAADILMPYSKSLPVEPGEWNVQYDEAMRIAKEERVPVVAMFVRDGCSQCGKLEAANTEDSVVQWRRERGYIFLLGIEGDKTKGANYSKVVKMSQTGSSLPFFGLYWDKDGDGDNDLKDKFKFCGRSGSMLVKSGTLAEQFMGTCDAILGEYEPVRYVGGTFTAPDEEGNRLEFEAGTKSVAVELTREKKAPEFATNMTFRVLGKDGKAIAALGRTIEWAANETNKTVALDLTKVDTAGYADGDKLTLLMIDAADGLAHATNHITYVKSEPSAANPLWLGERKDPYGIAPDFEFGEWTMDLDLATQVVAKAEGAAYTLVSIQGSKWCPDCANTDRNFLEVKDQSGINKFCQWAKTRNVALVSMDIPNYSSAGPTPETVASPTLFSKKAFETTLARPKEFPQSGADEALTNAMSRSGLGYLTRKGATDDEAAAVMAKFHKLAVTNTDKGGFHRPEDGNKYRTGVPIFVLLRKDGTVAARFTRFASVSPMKADRDNFDNYIKRFDEMLAIAAESGDHADDTEIENNYPGDGAIPFAANGGTASNELCNADFQDAFKLSGFGGNAKQRVQVKGASSAKVAVQFWKRTEDGSFESAGSGVTGTLSDGVELTQTFAEAGDYYLLVKGFDITSDEFAVDSTADKNFIGYAVTGSTILVPQDGRATATAPAGSKEVVIQLESGVQYRLTGLDPEVEANTNALAAVTGSDGFVFTAKIPGMVTLVCPQEGGSVDYQKWVPGKVGFEPQAKTLPEKKTTVKSTDITRKETDDVTVTYRRIEGVSGDVKIKVSLNAKETTFFYDWAPDAGWLGRDYPRFKINGVATNEWSETVEWKDVLPLEACVSNILVTAGEFETKEVSHYFGPGKVVFDLEIIEQTEAGVITNMVDYGRFTINFEENQKPSAGRVQVSGCDREWAKKLTVYARENEEVKVILSRIDAAEGPVFADLKKSVASVVLGGDYDNLLGLGWGNRDQDDKTVTVSNLPPAGKSVKLTLQAESPLKVDSKAGSITIVSVATDAPAFAQTTASDTFYRYTAVSNTYAVTGTVAGGELSFKKISGSLPSGLKVVWDKAANAMAVYGVPTGNDKAGKTYTSVYQVTEKRPKEPGSKSTVSVPGLTIELTYKVVDPAYAGTGKGGKALNASCAKSRTFKDLMIFAKDEELEGDDALRLIGTVQLTLPATGKASAKFLCESGTVSFAAKNWDCYEIDQASVDYGCGSCTLVGTTKNFKDWTMEVKADPDGEVHLRMFTSSAALNQLDFGKTPWSKTHPATDYSGYYTVTLAAKLDTFEEPIITGPGSDYAPVGSGYLTIKKMSSSQANSGTVTWAGMLPNGTKISGSGVLAEATEESAWLPMVKFTSKDKFAGVVAIKRGAASAVEGEDCWESVSVPNLDEGAVYTWWRHTENSTKTDKNEFTVRYKPYGGIYDSTYDLSCCCEKQQRSTDMTLSVVPDSFASDYYGSFKSVKAIGVTVGEHSITRKDSTGGANKITLSYNKSTGIVSGKFDLHYTDAKTKADKKLSATYVGVIQLGYGGCCGTVPSSFVNGCWYITDKIGYDLDETTGAFKKWLSSVKRGGVVTIEPAEAE